MGHSKSIHLAIYRQPLPLKDLPQVSQFLAKAQGTFNGKTGDIILEPSNELTTPKYDLITRKCLSNLKRPVDANIVQEEDDIECEYMIY